MGPCFTSPCCSAQYSDGRFFPQCARGFPSPTRAGRTLPHRISVVGEPPRRSAGPCPSWGVGWRADTGSSLNVRSQGPDACSGFDFTSLQTHPNSSARRAGPRECTVTHPLPRGGAFGRRCSLAFRAKHRGIRNRSTADTAEQDRSAVVSSPPQHRQS